jgi:putative nucleotidyltransferase with HDIG domain
VSTSQSNKPETGNSQQIAHHDELHHAIFPSGKDFFAWLTIGILGALLLFFSLTAGEMFSPGISEGDVAQKDIRATQETTIVDPEATASAVEVARQHVIPDFIIDREHDQQSLEDVKKQFEVIKQLQDAGIESDPILQSVGVSPAEHVFALTCSDDLFEQIMGVKPVAAEAQSEAVELLKKRLSSPPLPAYRKTRGRTAAAPNASSSGTDLLQRQRQILSVMRKNAEPITDEQIFIAVAVKPAELLQFGDTTLQATNRLLQQFSRFPVKNKHEWHNVVLEFLPDSWNPVLRSRVATAVCEALEPNLVIDPSGTKAKADAAVRDVKPVTRLIKQGDIVLKRGDVITAEKQEVLQALQVKSVKSTALMMVLGILLMAALGFSGLFLLTYEPKHFFSTTSIALMYTIGIVTSVATSVLGVAYPQFVPIPGAALLLTIFFRRRVAAALILPIIVLLFVEGLINGAHLLALTAAAIAAIISYSKRRNSLVFCGFVVGIAQALGFLCAYGIGRMLPFILGDRFAPYVAAWLPGTAPDIQTVGLQFAGGIVSSIIAIGSLPFLENIFGMVTPYRLIELVDAEQPLLRQLEEKAPGTYQHSLAVANLAEAGAKAIHADANLVRAGAMYHDIGKMVKARFFIENQLGATNPHDSMTPEESRDRVLAHVTDGIELAKKYSLPKAVEDFIPMHQGTTLMAYFYFKACQRDGAENVDASFYRYPGPKPQSRETAIVMLADVSEAVTHSMKDPSEAEVEQAIDKVFENRWQDGQFSESSLTYDELHRVKLAFVRVWRTLHHDRLKYPSTTTGKMAVPPVQPENTNGQKPADQSGGNGQQPVATALAIPDTNGQSSLDDPQSGTCDCVIAEFGPPGEAGGIAGGVTHTHGEKEPDPAKS